MKRKALIQIWLEQCCRDQNRAIMLLEKYGHHHSIFSLGDIGGATVRTSGMFFEFCSSGAFMIIQAVWEDNPSALNEVEKPVIFDFIAWHPQAPNRWFFYRGECGLILGEKSLFKAQIFGEPLYIHQTPLEWLKNAMVGIVLLDFYSLHSLIGIKQAVFRCPHFGQKIKKRLTAFIYKGFPQFGVETNQQKG